MTLLSCNNSKSNKQSDNTSFVEFFYHNEHAKYPMSYSCGKLTSGQTDSKPNYKKINDKEFTEKVISYYKNLKDAKDERFDARIHFLVHSPERVDTICMGKSFGIVVNGVAKEDSEEFANFIKNEIYKNE
ncbi:hypothetical protein [Flavobacterium channae]|uniref:hypothetical protein n=1 Tax=Flavobacterium channae TaxID=2897181 RepID=UPI001E3CCE55|nr:hypothetical protein [Flavobacterium channae]UGS22911.1 hypothetical protein LOS89_09010 [Flavobacterium channae]